MDTNVYHVTLPVIGLIRAESEDAAVAKMTGIVDRAGLSVYEQEEARVFESEEVPEEFVL